MATELDSFESSHETSIPQIEQSWLHQVGGTIANCTRRHTVVKMLWFGISVGRSM